MNKFQMTRDLKEVERIMEESVYKQPKIYALAVLVWHILLYIKRKENL